MSASLIPAELIFDSAAGLRRADQLLTEWRRCSPTPPTLDQALEADPAVGPVPEILTRAFSEILRVLETLGRSRAALERAAVDRLHRTTAKLEEVTSTTESAATCILDNLERGLRLLDLMDGEQPETGTQHRAQLRDLLHAMLAELQFQDITSQQLSYAATLLDDLESRLRAVADLIDSSVLGASELREHEHDSLAEVSGQHFDPAATAADAGSRQALADQIFS